MEEDKTVEEEKPQSSSLRRAIWRGCGIIAPPLVTLLLLIWIGRAIEDYVLLPLESAARTFAVWKTAEIKDAPPEGAVAIGDQPIEEGFDFEGTRFVHPPIGRRYLPDYVIRKVDANIDRLPTSLASPSSATDYHHAFVKYQYMQRWWTIPLLLLVFLSVLYFVGRFLAAGVGRFFVTAFERIINQLPVVRNLYSSVKQVTDFVLSEREIEFTRVVAVEYPRVGIWSLGFVTSDSLPPLREALNEELVSVFMPTSPMPMTGFTINVRRRDMIDLELTIDQAVQFIVSCGVVCPATIPQINRGNPALIDRLPRSDDTPSSETEL